MRALLILSPLLLVAAAGPQRDKPLDPAERVKVDKALAGYTAGAPMSCLPIGFHNLASTTYGRTIIYSDGGTRKFVNDTGGGCEGAAHGDALVSVQYQGRACSGDIIQTVDTTSRMATGSCALGEFVPYSKAR